MSDSFETPWAVYGILQARILGWLAIPSPGDLPHPWINPTAPVASPALQVDSWLLSHQGSPPNLMGNRERAWDGQGCDTALILRNALQCSVESKPGQEPVVEGNYEKAAEESTPGQSEPGKRQRCREQWVALSSVWSSIDATCWMGMREMAVGKAEECLGFSLEHLDEGELQRWGGAWSRSKHLVWCWDIHRCLCDVWEGLLSGRLDAQSKVQRRLDWSCEF